MLDDFRKKQLRRMDTHRLRECVAWGKTNQPHSQETKFAAAEMEAR